MDAAEVYAQSRARMIDMARNASPEALANTVPATPAWSGLDLVRHVVGIPSDVLAGRLDGVGGSEWSQRQVDERQGTSVHELVEEWQGTAESFDAMVAGAPPGMVGALAADILHHELDLRAALDQPAGESMSGAVDFGVNLMAGFLDRRIRKAELPALKVVAESQEWTLGEGEPAAALTTTNMEFFRALAGRRSESQVRAMQWEGDPAPYFPVLSAFGPLSPTDVAD